MPLPVITVLIRLVPIFLSAVLRAAGPVAGRLLDKKSDKEYAEALKLAALSQREVVTNQNLAFKEAEYCREIAIMHWLVVQALCRRTLEHLETEMFETQTTDDLWLHHEISHYKQRIADLHYELPSLEDDYHKTVSKINPAGIRFGVVRYDKKGTMSSETLSRDGKEVKENLESLIEEVNKKLSTLV